MDEALPVTEPRSSPRQRSLMGAVLSFHNGRSTLDCLVRNISDSGARLSVSPSVSLPPAHPAKRNDARGSARVAQRKRSWRRVRATTSRRRKEAGQRGRRPEAAHPRVGARGRSTPRPRLRAVRRLTRSLQVSSDLTERRRPAGRTAVLRHLWRIGARRGSLSLPTQRASCTKKGYIA